MSEGRISLRVLSEVSELSNENGISLSQAVTATSVNSLTVLSITTRPAETKLEIPSGSSMAMAGLIQEQTKQPINGLPGLMQMLGTLFRSRDYVNNQTEPRALVTPFVVRAVAQKDLSRPDDGFAAPADPRAELLGNMLTKPSSVQKRSVDHRSSFLEFLDLTGLLNDEAQPCTVCALPNLRCPLMLSASVFHACGSRSTTRSSP